MKLCSVVAPGLFTTVQDRGRYGFQRYGVPISGAMDVYAFVAANQLVANDVNAACLEITLTGPTLEFHNDAPIAITGGAATPTINGEPAPCWQTLQVRRGDHLTLRTLQSGCRAYLAVGGGIDVPLVLGSRSTYARGGFGGFHGRRLRKGDVIAARKPGAALRPRLSIPRELIPEYGREVTVEVVMGPQSDCFIEAGVDTVLSEVYSVTSESDRMGYRLSEPEIHQKDAGHMVSDAIPIGAVQVPRSGQPIIVMRDAQTTGGYPKLAVVTTPDVARLGQVRPNDRIRFSRISLHRARARFLTFQSSLAQMHEKLVESAW
jgi:antagonist of KipI